MQVTKTYSGSVTLESATVKREVSYGVTTTLAVYPSKVDTVNSIIAYFLRQECGVDAWYEARGESSYKFLWIYNVPFLFNISGTTSYAAFYGPLNAGVLNASTDTTADYSKGLSKLFNGATGTYSFGLVFAGNPQNGFALRFKTYNSAAVSAYFTMRFMKCTNLINGLTGVVWSGQNIYSTGNITAGTGTLLLGGMNGIDLNPDNTLKEGSFSNQLNMYYTTNLYTKNTHMSSNEGALPLVPLCVGPYRANGIYLRPVGFNLPVAVPVATEIQAEITVSGRSFLITNSDGVILQLYQHGADRDDIGGVKNGGQTNRRVTQRAGHL